MDRYVARPTSNGTWEIFDQQQNEPTGHHAEAGLTAEAATIIARYFNEGKCPTCPAQPMKQRRSRCPICKAWISYVPDHAGHKYPGFQRGRIVWRRLSFKPAYMAWLHHMNQHASDHTGQAFVDGLYEPAAQEATSA